MDGGTVTKGVTREGLERLLRDAEQAHGAYEATLGRRDDNWPSWYADYMLRRLQNEGTEDGADAGERNKALVRRFLHEVIGQADVAAADALCAPTLIWHGVGIGDLPDLATLKGLLVGFFAAFADIAMSVQDLVAAGDRVAARYTWRGTHRGVFQGLPPTGRTVAVAGSGIFRVAGGQIVEEWWQEDLLGLLRQLGAIPAPA
jgi:steroid delta-isomerase-like uncharacterized protein